LGQESMPHQRLARERVRCTPPPTSGIGPSGIHPSGIPPSGVNPSGIPSSSVTRSGITPFSTVHSVVRPVNGRAAADGRVVVEGVVTRMAPHTNHAHAEKEKRKQESEHLVGECVGLTRTLLGLTLFYTGVCVRLLLVCVCPVWVPLRWWVLCGALPSVWVPCLGPLGGSPVWVPSVWVPCVSPLCGSHGPSRLRHVASTRVMSPARSHAPA